MTRVRHRTIRTLHLSIGAVAESPLVNSHASMLRRYAFRQGVTHFLSVDEVTRATPLITDFDMNMDRARSESGPRAGDIALDALAVVHALAGRPQATIRIWARFYRQRANLLARGSDSWGSDRILLQLATEAPRESIIARASEQWVAIRKPDWCWLRRLQRTADSSLDWVLEGHRAEVSAYATSAGHLVTGDRDGVVLRWNVRRAICSEVGTHGARIKYLDISPQGRVASFDDKGTLCVWTPDDTMVFEQPEPSHVTAMWFSADTRLILVTHAGVVVYRLTGGYERTLLEGATAWRLLDGATAFMHAKRIQICASEPCTAFMSERDADWILGQRDKCVVGGSGGWECWMRRDEAWFQNGSFSTEFQWHGGARAMTLEGDYGLWFEPFEGHFEKRRLEDGALVAAGTFDQRLLPVTEVVDWGHGVLLVIGAYSQGVHRVWIDGARSERVTVHRNAIRYSKEQAISTRGRQIFVWQPREPVQATRHSDVIVDGFETESGLLLTWSMDGSVLAWNPNTATCVFQLSAPGMRVAGCGLIASDLLVLWRRFRPHLFELWETNPIQRIAAFHAGLQGEHGGVSLLSAASNPVAQVQGARYRVSVTAGEVVVTSVSAEDGGQIRFAPTESAIASLLWDSDRHSRTCAETEIARSPWMSHLPLHPLMVNKAGILVGGTAAGEVVFLERICGSSSALIESQESGSLQTVERASWSGGGSRGVKELEHLLHRILPTLANDYKALRNQAQRAAFRREVLRGINELLRDTSRSPETSDDGERS